MLLTEDEARHSFDIGDRYVIAPHRVGGNGAAERGTPLPDGFRYASDNNDQWLGADDLRAMADGVPPGRRAADRQGAEPGWEA